MTGVRKTGRGRKGGDFAVNHIGLPFHFLSVGGLWEE